jgi:diaminopimelate epimerase
VKLQFTKMHGAGNDFVVIDAVRQDVALKPSLIRRLADRHRGIGCDQVLVVEPPDDPEADFRYRIFNADGSDAGQCGNGARCFARFIREQRLSAARTLRVQTNGGMMELLYEEDGRISANLGPPRLAPAHVPFLADNPALEYGVDLDGDILQLGVLSMGNPHAVLWVDDVDQAPVSTLGPALETHPRFPDRANIGFAQRLDAQQIRLRVWERGAGETQACGSGACAAVVHGIRRGELEDTVTVHLPGGKLTVRWRGAEDDPVWLSGPTATVFEGAIKLRGN